MNKQQTRILIIDDDELICETLEDILTELGYSVELCTVSGEIEHSFLHNNYDVILIDIKLEGIDGGAVCEMARVQCPSAAIIFITACPDEATIMECMRKGALSILHKPFEIEALVERIENRNMNTILIVEPNQAILSGFARFLRDEGYYIKTAIDATEAKKEMIQQRPRIIIFDLDTTISDEDTLFEDIKISVPDTKIICLSSLATPHPKLITKCVKCGACAYLRKPFHNHELRDLIKHTLAPT